MNEQLFESRMQDIVSQSSHAKYILLEKMVLKGWQNNTTLPVLQ